MQKEELSYQGYEFEFRGGRSNSYFFETDKEIFYEVRFTPTDYLFNEVLFNENTYEFSIIVADNPTSKNPIFDARTSYTIAGIFRDFYEQSEIKRLVTHDQAKLYNLRTILLVTWRSNPVLN